MISWVQSYDYFLKVVSVAYGKDKSKRKRETATNQYIMKRISADRGVRSAEISIFGEKQDTPDNVLHIKRGNDSKF